MLYSLLNKELPDNTKRYVEFESVATKLLVDSMEYSFINGSNQLSVPFWSEKIGAKLFTAVSFALGEEKWINGVVKPNFAYIELNETKLAKYIDTTKYRKDMRIKLNTMKCVNSIMDSNLTKTPNSIEDTGLVRDGFAKCASMKFQLDTVAMLKHYELIKSNLVKGMTNVAKKYPDVLMDEANYKAISEEVLDYYLCNPKKYYNLESNINDMRGRSIYSGIRKVGNIIANKDMRALIIADKSVFILDTNKKALDDIYLFIAELVDSKAKSWNGKILSGMVSYKKKRLPNMTAKTLHEIIWLERIYEALDQLFIDGSIMWNIPLEMDATASIAQIVGVLTNDRRLLAKTNVIEPETLEDFWYVKGVNNRDGIKAIGTPVGLTL